MTVSLYTVTDDRRVVNKNLGTAVGTVNCIVKDDCDILNPELELAYFTGVENCNYIHIPNWNRYYYIDNITFSKQRVYIKCHVDVLMTYTTAVRNSKVIVRRSSEKDKYWLYLDDPYFMTSADDIVEVIKFPNEDVFTSKSFLLTVAGPRGGV